MILRRSASVLVLREKVSLRSSPVDIGVGFFAAFAGVLGPSSVEFDSEGAAALFETA